MSNMLCFWIRIDQGFLLHRDEIGHNFCMKQTESSAFHFSKRQQDTYQQKKVINKGVTR